MGGKLLYCDIYGANICEIDPFKSILLRDARFIALQQQSSLHHPSQYLPSSSISNQTIRSCLEWRCEEAGHEGVLNLALLIGAEMGMAGGSRRRGGGLTPPEALLSPASLSLGGGARVIECCW